LLLSLVLVFEEETPFDLDSGDFGDCLGGDLEFRLHLVHCPVR